MARDGELPTPSHTSLPPLPSTSPAPTPHIQARRTDSSRGESGPDGDPGPVDEGLEADATTPVAAAAPEDAVEAAASSSAGVTRATCRAVRRDLTPYPAATATTSTAPTAAETAATTGRPSGPSPPPTVPPSVRFPTCAAKDDEGVGDDEGEAGGREDGTDEADTYTIEDGAPEAERL